MMEPKLLIIDDEEINVKVLSMSLRADGYDVVTANSGEEGLSVFQREHPAIVLTDIKMPGMDGIEVLRRVKELDAYPEVIIITGHGDIDAAIEALKYGASDFINKPVRDDVLGVALDRAKEKLSIKRRLREYTQNLENMVHAATEEVKRRSYFQEQLIRSSTDGIVATDREWKVVIYNPGAENIFGYPRADVIGKRKAHDLFPPELVNAFLEKSRTHDDSKEIRWHELYIKNINGEKIPTRCSGTLLYERKQPMGSVAFFHDLSEIKHLEKELVHSERLAAIGQTIAGMAHGIKNILHGFKGGSYLINIGIERKDSNKIQNGWRIIQKNIERTSQLIMDLLSFAKDREPEYRVCSLNGVIEDVLEVMKDIARENDVSLESDLSPAIGESLLDPDTVHAALLNLLSNALDACILDEHAKDRYRVTVRSYLDADNRLCVDVEDNGSGMKEDVLDKIFTSFFSTKGVKGTGLGLLVTKKLVEEHEGHIQVSSRWGKGTKFTIRLPLKPAPDKS